MTTNDKAPKYLLPKPTRRGYEVMPGWGLVELGVTDGGVVISESHSSWGAWIVDTPHR